MTTKQDGETRTVLRKLLILLIIFYLVNYIVILILAGAFHLWNYEPSDPDLAEAEFNAGLLPFWHHEFGPGLSGDRGKVALTAWLAMVISQFALLLAIFFVVRSTKHAWDYAVTVSTVHLIVTCAATVSGPTGWEWWVTLVVCTLVVMTVSELMCYFLHDLRAIEKS